MGNLSGINLALLATVLASAILACWVLGDRSVGQRLRRRLFPPKEKLFGYENRELVDVIVQKTIAYRPNSNWPDIADAKNVLDFGGGAGRHYKEANSATIRWAVVETPAMVERCMSTDRLKFFTNIEAAKSWLGEVDVVHCNGALHFSSDPSATLKQLCGVGARKMLWYRVHLGTKRGIQVSHLVDNGPGIAPATIENKSVEYNYQLTPESEFLTAHNGYRLVARGEDSFTFIK